MADNMNVKCILVHVILYEKTLETRNKSLHKMNLLTSGPINLPASIT